MIAVVAFAVVAIAVGAFLITSGLTHRHTGNSEQNGQINYMLGISNGTLQVPNNSYTFYSFSAPPGASNAQVNGSFSMQGNGSSISILILDDKNFADWKAGHQISTYYSSTQLTGTIKVSVPLDKKLYLLFDNTLSKESSKTISSQISLIYNNNNGGVTIRSTP